MKKSDLAQLVILTPFIIIGAVVGYVFTALEVGFFSGRNIIEKFSDRVREIKNKSPQPPSEITQP